MLTTAGRLWLAGVGLRWKRLYTGQQLQRLGLPTYPFERRRHWPASSTPKSSGSAPDSGSGNGSGNPIFYLPAWRRTLPLHASPAGPGAR